MANKNKKVVYWDSCVWITYAGISYPSESSTDTEEMRAGCKQVIRSAKAGKTVILTSEFSIIEVCKVPEKDADEVEGIPEFFHLDYVSLIPISWHVVMFARKLMRSKYRKLKPKDAIHLAAAAVHNVDEFHTSDEDLIKLDGMIECENGYYLKICLPSDQDEPDLLRIIDEG